MTSIPDIDKDRLEGFKRMAKAVIDDMAEAATDMAGRHTHQVDLLKARVDELEETIQKQRAAVRALHGENNDAAAALGEAIGADVPTLEQAVPAVIAKLQAAPAPQFFGLTVADLAEVLKEEAEDEHGGAVKKCLVIDDGAIAVVDTIRELCAQLRFLNNAVPHLVQAKPRAVADLPVQAGPFVITRKDAFGRRFWNPFPSGMGNGWTPNLASAQTYPDASAAERSKPRGSRVVTLQDARELIEAEKVTSIAPSADAPGPEAA